MDNCEPIIKISNVSKSYPLRQTMGNYFLSLFKKFFKFFLRHPNKVRPSSQYNALQSINVTIEKGDSCAFIGINGSGKSTLLKMISGNIRPSSGSLEINGKVAILDYGSGFNGELTGKENIFLRGSILGLSKKQILQRFNSIEKFADIGDFINQPVKIYSSGMVARLGFAIMAHVDADIIISDEALAVGDVFFVQKCMQHIRNYLQEGTFLFVSHSMNDVVSLCKKAIWLEKGRIIASGSAAEVTQAYLDKVQLSFPKNLNDWQNPERLLLAENIVTQIEIKQPFINHQINAQDDCESFSNPSLLSQSQSLFEIINCNFEEKISVDGAKIIRVDLFELSNHAGKIIRGGEIVTLLIHVQATKRIQDPIIGFQLINKKGQTIFACNSSLIIQDKILLVKAETVFAAEFTFKMPHLPLGEYRMRLAVASGKEDNAFFYQTIDQGLILRTIKSPVIQGLLGIEYCSETDVTTLKPPLPFEENVY